MAETPPAPVVHEPRVGHASRHLVLPPSRRDAIEQLQDLVTKGKLTAGAVMALATKAQELVLKANAELMPYFESKRPQQLQVDKRVLGVMVIGDMATERPDDGAVMDLTRTEKPT